jgi:hypothetical protein
MGGRRWLYVHVMVPSLAMLSSPMLGPSVWQPVAQILADRGWQTMICAASAPLHSGQDVLDAFLDALPMDRELVLVPHSNAGAYVPALTTQRRVVAAVFVDAVLPPDRGRVPLAPPAFLDFLREKADGDGLLPVWTSWWDEAEVAALFPDAGTRARLERDQLRLPLSYFEGSLPVPEGWDDRPGAYLAFGDSYGHERDQAERRRWPVSTLPAEHLHLLKDPDHVATELLDLMWHLGISAFTG